jgi:hypothetical protein
MMGPWISVSVAALILLGATFVVSAQQSRDWENEAGDRHGR